MYMMMAPDHSHEQAGGKAHDRCGGQGFHHVVQQATHAAGEDSFFALFRVISLDHAHPAQRLREASCHFGVDLSPLAKNGTDRSECLVQRDGKAKQKAECQQRHHRADAEEHDHRNAGGEQPADQVDQSGPQQVPHAFDIAHDARNQRAGLVRIVERNRKVRDVRLHLLTKFRDQTLGGFR